MSWYKIYITSTWLEMISDMKRPNSIRMNSESKERCMKMVETEDFTSISEIIEYAMRRFYEHIVLDGVTSLPYVRRSGKRVSMSMRMNTVLEKNILDTGLLDRSDIVDYALDYFFSVNERMERALDAGPGSDMESPSRTNMSDRDSQ